MVVMRVQEMAGLTVYPKVDSLVVQMVEWTAATKGKMTVASMVA